MAKKIIKKRKTLKPSGIPKPIGVQPGSRKISAAEKATQFKPGNKLGGRPVGSRNKLGDAFLKDFLAVWETDGRDALIDVRIKDPSTFVRAAVAILPKELNINHDVSEVEALLEQFDIEQLDELIHGIATLGAHQLSKEAKNKATARGKSNSVH